MLEITLVTRMTAAHITSTNMCSESWPSEGCSAVRKYEGSPVASSPTAVPRPMTPPMKITSPQSTPCIHSGQVSTKRRAGSATGTRHIATGMRIAGTVICRFRCSRSAVSFDATKRARSGANHKRMAQTNQPIAHRSAGGIRPSLRRSSVMNAVVSGRANAFDPTGTTSLNTISAVARKSTARTVPMIVHCRKLTVTPVAAAISAIAGAFVPLPTGVAMPPMLAAHAIPRVLASTRGSDVSTRSIR